MYRILNGIPLGIQSYTLRTYANNEDVAKALKECELDAIDLSKRHIDVFNSSEADRIMKSYYDEGISVSTCGIHVIPNDVEKVRPVFDFAKRHGMKVLCADPDPDAFGLLENLCNEYGVKLALHNHGRKSRYGTVEKMQQVVDSTSDNFGFCLDTAWIMETGADPAEVVRKYGNRLYGLHLKDFTFEGEGVHREVIVGRGNLNLKALRKALEEINYNGYASLEYEGSIDNPIPGVKACIEEIMKVFGK